MEINVKLFVKSEVDKYMQALDLGDRGKKIFGMWVDAKLTTTKEEVTDYDIKRLIQVYLDKDRVYYCQIRNMYGFKSKEVHALSTGNAFIFVNDMKKALKENNVIEVVYET